MVRRHRTAFLSVWCCAPFVLSACGDESSGATVDGGSDPTVTTATTSSVIVPLTVPSTVPSTEPSTEPSTVPSTNSSPNSPPEATMPATDRPATPEPGTSSNLEIATADVRARVGADVEIEVISREEVTWPSGALGCPEPGMAYTQALVNGERIVLRADGVDYEYHSGKNRPAFYCPPSRITPPVTGSYGDV